MSWAESYRDANSTRTVTACMCSGRHKAQPCLSPRKWRRWVPDGVFGYVAQCRKENQDLIVLDPVAYGARLLTRGVLGRLPPWPS